MPYAILASALVLLDQVSKLLACQYIPEGGSIPLLPGLMDLHRIHNTGCAFSLLEGQTLLLTVISAVLSAVLALAVARKFFRHPLGRVSLTLVLAGAIGNLIDRAVFGCVVDMFRTLFISFAVFNVADICVVVGGIATAAYYILLWDRLEGKHDEPAHPDQ